MALCASPAVIIDRKVCNFIIPPGFGKSGILHNPREFEIFKLGLFNVLSKKGNNSILRIPISFLLRSGDVPGNSSEYFA